MIPEELKRYKQWVVWKYVLRDSKYTKVPYSFKGYRASVRDPSDWGTYEDVKQVMDVEQPIYDGIGFVFTDKDPFIGVDWDHIIVLPANIIGSEYYEEIMSLDTYAEISPSGEGVHAICRGILPKCKHRGNGREIYKTGRFFTVTGSHLDNTPFEIKAPPAVALEVILNKIDPPEQKFNQPIEFSETPVEEQDAKRIVKFLVNNRKFVKLVQGNWDGYKSQSEADYALCLILTDYTNNPAMIKYIFKRTKLYRPKFDGKYGDITVNAALSHKLIKDILEEL